MTRVDDLALYHFESCPYCRRVRDALRRLQIEIELRDIQLDPRHRQELIAARGRPTVPVLRLRSPEGDRWMPESADIVRYLEERFATR